MQHIMTEIYIIKLIAIGNIRTTEMDIRDLWNILQTCLSDMSVV